MLRLSQLKAGEVFLDMGSGMGKACVATGLLYPDLAVCKGVELLEGLHRQAEVGRTQMHTHTYMDKVGTTYIMRRRR